MFILLPISVMLLTAVTLVTLRFVRPNFNYTWVLAVGGASLALIGIFLWKIHFPQSVSLGPWQPATIFVFSPTWVADGTSWPYALSLSGLGTAVIWTSVVGKVNDPVAWAGTLLLTSLGILAVSAENTLSLILVWSALDLAELLAMLRSTEGEERTRNVVLAFAARIAGTGLILWANLVTTTNGMTINFSNPPTGAGIFLILAAGLRLGIIPLQLPYKKENVLRRGFGTSIRLVSAAASLSLVARVPANAIKTSLVPFIMILAALAALYAGWMWMQSSDEILGRPFWVLGVAALSVSAILRGNAIGSIGWGVMLILGGGLLFLYSARQRSLIWLPLLGLWGLSSLPFSPTGSAWESGYQNSWIYIIPFLPAQAMLMAGIVRHSFQPGETSLESQERWTRYIYPTGLFLLTAIIFLLGLWGWDGVQRIGQLWAAIVANIFTAGFIIFTFSFMHRFVSSSNSRKWTRILRFEWLYYLPVYIYYLLRRIAEVITSSLEGEGGLLWSLLLLALILSVLSTQGR